MQKTLDKLILEYQMLDDKENSRDINSEIIELFERKEFESLISKIQCLEEDQFEDPFILNLLGKTYLELNDKENAKLYFSHTLALEPYHRDAIINLGNLEYKDESYQNAFDYYAKLTKDGTAEPTFLGYMGKCLFELGHIEDGITLCEEAIKIDPHCEKPYFLLAEMMHQNRDPEAVINYYYQVLEQNPDSFSTYFELGNYFKKIKCFNMALNFYNKCLSVNPEFKEAHFKKANIFSKTGKHNESISVLRQIIELDNQNSEAFNLIGVELEKLNFSEEARERFLDSIYLNSENSNAYYNLGNNLIKSGKLVDAHECLDKFQKNSQYSTKRFLGLDKLILIVLDYLLNNEKEYKNYFNEKVNNSSVEDLITKLEINKKSIDLKNIFEKVYPFENNLNTFEANQNNIKDYTCLVGFEKSGSLFLHSLLDGHPEISTLPGYFFSGWFNQNSWPIFKPDYCEVNWRENLADNICKYFEPQFDNNSKKKLIGKPKDDNLWLNNDNGFTQLGENNSEPMALDQDIFKNYLVDLLMPFDEINPKICFDMINEAFDKAYRKNSGNSKKVTLYHQYKPSVFERANFNYFYPNNKTLLLVSNPIQMLANCVLHDLAKLQETTGNKVSFFDDDSFYEILTSTKNILSILEYFINPMNSFKNVKGVRLEDIKSNPKQILPKIEKWIGIKNNNSLYESNFLGKNISIPSINFNNIEGFNTEATDDPIGRVFHSRDIQILETLFWPIMKEYGYTKMAKKQFTENLKKIRPWLDEPFEFEKDIHKKLPDDTPKIENLEGLNKFRKNLIIFWELLNSKKAYRHIFKLL